MKAIVEIEINDEYFEEYKDFFVDYKVVATRKSDNELQWIQFDTHYDLKQIEILGKRE